MSKEKHTRTLEEQVELIKRLYNHVKISMEHYTYNQREIAAAFEVRPQTICNMRKLVSLNEETPIPVRRGRKVTIDKDELMREIEKATKKNPLITSRQLAKRTKHSRSTVTRALHQINHTFRKSFFF